MRFLLTTLFALAASAVQAADYDILFVNARGVDGTGNPSFRADVGLRDGRIWLVGRDEEATAELIMDVQEAHRRPGLHRRAHSLSEQGGELPTCQEMMQTIMKGKC